jgi:hypothetical protein
LAAAMDSIHKIQCTTPILIALAGALRRAHRLE